MLQPAEAFNTVLKVFTKGKLLLVRLCGFLYVSLRIFLFLFFIFHMYVSFTFLKLLELSFLIDTTVF